MGPLGPLVPSTRELWAFVGLLVCFYFLCFLFADLIVLFRYRPPPPRDHTENVKFSFDVRSPSFVESQFAHQGCVRALCVAAFCFGDESAEYNILVLVTILSIGLRAWFMNYTDCRCIILTRDEMVWFIGTRDFNGLRHELVVFPREGLLLEPNNGAIKLKLADKFRGDARFAMTSLDLGVVKNSAKLLCAF